jgi:hypothetical protein
MFKGVLHPVAKIIAGLGKSAISLSQPFQYAVLRIRRSEADPEREPSLCQHVDCIQHHVLIKSENEVFIHALCKPGFDPAFFRKLNEKDDAAFVSHRIHRKTSMYSIKDIDRSPVLSESLMIAIRARAGGLRVSLPKGISPCLRLWLCFGNSRL